MRQLLLCCVMTLLMAPASASETEVPHTAMHHSPSEHTQPTALDQRISEQSFVEVRRFVYEAPALETQIAALLLGMTGRPVEISELLATKDEINRLYVKHGFVNTGVVIPDQQIIDGELRLDFVSGEIADLQISSLLAQNYVEGRLEIEKPFNLMQLQHSLKLLEQDPLVSRVDARVAAGARPGEAVLALDVETHPRFSLGLDLGNDRSPSIGSHNANLMFRASNLSGWGETYQLSTSVTEGLNSQDASLYVPLTSGGTSLKLQYAISDSSVIEEPFSDIDVGSETESLSLLLDVPIRRTLSSKLALHLTLEARRNQTTLLGQAFSFSEGAVNGESRVAPVRLAISYTEQNINDSLAARFSISRGTSQFDATENNVHELPGSSSVFKITSGKASYHGKSSCAACCRSALVYREVCPRRHRYHTRLPSKPGGSGQCVSRLVRTALSPRPACLD